MRSRPVGGDDTVDCDRAQRAFLVGGTVKIAYDLTLWWMFRRVKPRKAVRGEVVSG